MISDAIPAHIQAALDEYAEAGRPVGDFLQAVLSNDLTGAVCRADAGNLRAIRAIAQYVYNELPSRCHGDRARYTAWLEAKRAEREAVAGGKAGQP